MHTRGPTGGWRCPTGLVEWISYIIVALSAVFAVVAGAAEPLFFFFYVRGTVHFSLFVHWFLRYMGKEFQDFFYVRGTVHSSLFVH